MTTYLIRTSVQAIQAQDDDDAIREFNRWVKRHGLAGEFYWLVDGEENQIHAGELATNPEQRDDPYRTVGRYIHNQGDGTFHAYIDGWSQTTQTRRSYEDASHDLFHPWAGGGYNALYYPIDTNGDISFGPLCAECARTDWLENGGDFHVENDDGEQRYLDDIRCAACDEVITEQICSECGDALSEERSKKGLPIFRAATGYALHGACIVKLIENGQMLKDRGLQRYVFCPYVGLPWYGHQRFSAEGIVYAANAEEAGDRTPVASGA